MDKNHNDAHFCNKLCQLRTLRPEDRIHVADRLTAFYEKMFDDPYAVRVHPHRVIGFYEKNMPSIIGFVAADRRLLDDLSCVIMYESENADPGFEVPFMKVGLPGWIRGFRIAGFLADPMATDNLKKRKAIQDRLIAVTTAAVVRLWTIDCAFINSDKDIAVAAYDAPLLHKRAILAKFPFVEADISCEDLHRNKVVYLPEAASSTRKRNGTIFFFTRKVELTIEETQKKICFLHENNITVLVVMYHWKEISEVLQELVSFDGCVVLPLSASTDVQRLVACQLKKPSSGPLTRAQEDQLLIDELSWAFPLLFSEGHLERTEFEMWLSDKLECVLCHNKEKHNSEEHTKMVYHQVRFHSLQLRKEEHHLNKELCWYDSDTRTVKRMCAESMPDPPAFIFENPSPGTPGHPNFLGWTVPSTEADWVPDLFLSE